MTDIRGSWDTGILALLLVASSVLFAACESGGTSETQAEVRDSAGIRLVENPSVEDLEDLGWRLSPEPLIQVGALEGPPETQLFRVRDAMRLEDGRLLILDGGSNQVRVFDKTGGFLETWGGAGEGPGEFLSARLLMRWSADSIAVWDNRHRRLTRFDLDGELGPSLGIPGEETTDRPDVVGLTERGHLLVRTPRFSEAIESGYVRIPTRIGVIDRVGGEVGDLGVYPGDEAVMQVGEGTISILRMPVTRTVIATPFTDQVMVAGTDRLSFTYFDVGGELVAIVRFPDAPRPLTEADREAALERYLSRMPEQTRAGIRLRADELFAVDTLPAFSAAVGDATGLQWVQLYRPPWTPGPDRWIVMDDEGTAVGSIQMPAGFTIYEVGSDYVLGHITDELEIEYVQLWGLERQ